MSCLVWEVAFIYPERFQASTPEDVADIFQDYYQDKDREEFLAVMLDTANMVICLTLVSIGGLAASIVKPGRFSKPPSWLTRPQSSLCTSIPPAILSLVARR